MPGLFRNPLAGLASQLASAAQATGFAPPIEIEKPPTALDWLNREDFLLDELPETERDTIVKAMNRLRTALPKVTRAGVLATQNKLYMEATIAEKTILGYDKLVGVTVTPKSFDDLRMMTTDDLTLFIDENTPYGRVLVVFPTEGEDSPKEMRVLSQNEADDQELFDLIDYFEATFEPSPDYLPEGEIPPEDIEEDFLLGEE